MADDLDYIATVDAAAQAISQRITGLPRHVIRQAAAYAVATALPLIEAAARADERAKVAEDIATALLAVDPIEWALAGQSAGEDAAAIARRHAQPAQIDAPARKPGGGSATKDDTRDDRQEQRPMGMYTELHFNAELIRDTPHRITDVLAYMTGTTRSEPAALPDHALFGTRHWDLMLQCDSSYFPLSTASSIDHEYGRHYLRVRSNFKNYDGEIEKFLDWIMPWVDADTECLGYWRYEENDHPTLIYKTAPAGGSQT